MLNESEEQLLFSSLQCGVCTGLCLHRFTPAHRQRSVTQLEAASLSCFFLFTTHTKANQLSFRFCQTPDPDYKSSFWGSGEELFS